MSCPKGQVNDAGLCYPPCDPGFTGVGPLCWPQCPKNWVDIGVSCTKPSYGRGVGTIPTGCPVGQEKDAALCYPNCQTGYSGVGPVCWGECPENFTDNGAFCLKPSAYGRGAGHTSQQNCENSGDHGAKENGCEKSGGLWYPKCDKNFHAFACCICTPNCPDGWTDIGISCVKPSYGRGAGYVPETCEDGKVNDAGLCYTPCDPSMKGVGPVCWGICPSNNFRDDGAFCAKLTKDRGIGTIPDYGIARKILLFLGLFVLVLLILSVLFYVIKKKIAG